MFDHKLRYRLDLAEFGDKQPNGSYMTIINKLRIVYCFSEERLGLTKFINQIKTLKMYLYCEGELLGNLDFDLNDFLNEKVTKREFFK